jgi:hypothetical protein
VGHHGLNLVYQRVRDAMAKPEEQSKDHDPRHDEDTEGQAVVALVLRQDCRQK